MNSKASKTLLVVDDEEDLREYLISLFEPLNYRILEASSGNAAWRLLQNEPIDVVITDVMMADGDGIQLLDRIKARDSETPAVILVSGYAKISVQEAYEKGAEAFFPKPFDARSLKRAVEDSLLPKVTRWNRNRNYQRIEDHDRKLILNVSHPDLLTATFNASVINIGRGGMFLAWGADFPIVGEQVGFAISFLDEPDKKFEGKGIVRWVRQARDEDNRLPGFGVEFTYLEENQAVNILEVLNFLKTKEFIPRS